MKKIIKDVDEKKGIVQVTVADERWYFRPGKTASGIPEYLSVPSVTWIAGSYPKGVPFYRWLADKGWDESQAIKQAAGDKGSKVHKAIDDVLMGKEVRIDSKYLNPSSEQEEELSLEECDAILSFKKWFEAVKPESICWEITIFSDKHNYAGTVDYICKIGEEYWIIDFKTSANIWKEYELQVSAYRRTIENGENEVLHHGKQIDVTKLKVGILQVGYKRNKDGYKFTEIDDKFELFQTAQKIWKEEHGEEQPNKKDYPIILSPAITVEEVLESQKVEVKPKVKK